MIKKVQNIFAYISKYIKESKRDYILLVLLLIIQVGSGTTSVLGAEEVLPRELARTIGITIQSLLFLLLSGLTATHAPVRKWIAILVLTFLSIYTSFFINYKFIAGDVLETEADSKALQVHATLVAKVYSPIQDEYRDLDAEATVWEEKAKRELNGLTTGIKGRGPIAKSFEVQAIEKRQEANKLKSIKEDLDPLFNYETEGLEPKEIFQKDSKAWRNTPEKFREKHPKPEIKNYIIESTQIGLLAGYNKVREGEQAAIVSMFIAIAVDGISLMLGTAININPKNTNSRFSIIDFLEKNISKIIIDIKSAKNRLRDSWNKLLPRVNNFQIDRYEIITLMLDGKCSEFLEDFVYSIEPLPEHKINEEHLKSHENETFRRGYRRLIKKLQELRWIQRKSDTWVVEKERFNRLTRWFSEEIERHIQEENKENNWLPFINNNELNRVQIRIPILDLSDN